MTISDDDPRLEPIALRKELLAAGYDDRHLARGIRDGSLHRPRRGAYVDGPRWRTMTGDERYAVRVRAAERQAVADVVLSHVSALPFLDAPLHGHRLDDVHLTRRDGRCGRREAGVCQHRGRHDDDEIVHVAGLAVSSPLRAVLECGTVSSAESTLIVANHFLHRGDFTHDQLRQRYANLTEGWPGSLGTRIAIKLADARIASPGESRTSYFFHAQGLPRPVPQFEVRDAGGFVAFLDFALPELGVWFEFDGAAKYEEHRRPGETVADVVLREKRREDRVRELTGWRCFRITWADLADPVLLAARIRDFLRQGGRRPPTLPPAPDTAA